MAKLSKLLGLAVMAGTAAGALAYYNKKKEEEAAAPAAVDPTACPEEGEDKFEEDLKALFDDFEEAADEAVEEADETEADAEPSKADIIKRDLREILSILREDAKVYTGKAKVEVLDAAEKAKAGLQDTYETVMTKVKEYVEEPAAEGEESDIVIDVEDTDGDGVFEAVEEPCCCEESKEETCCCEESKEETCCCESKEEA